MSQFNVLQETLQTLFFTMRENGTKVEATAAIGEDLRRATGRMNELMSGFTFSHADAEHVVQDEYHEQRNAPRHNRSMLLKITQGDMKLDAISQDISLQGMKLALPRPVDPSLPLEITIFLPHDDLRAYESQTPIVLSGKVAWQKTQEGRSRCVAGVQFIHLTDIDRYKIEQCINFFSLSSEPQEA